MENQDYYAIGIMSGSSLDGLDLVYCKFSKTSNWSFEILNSAIYPLEKFHKRLENPRDLDKLQLDILDKEFGEFIGEKTKDFIENNSITKLDIISSHGHTVYHFPEKGITKQIGSRLEIYKSTLIPVLNNLRQKDIDLGGSGAPIVPIGDLHLFKKYRYCLNIGGIANISIKTQNSIIAFDICSANQVLNYFSKKKDLDFDDNGSLARIGKFNLELFEDLNNLSFYNLKHPKSLDNHFTLEVLKVIEYRNIEIEDCLNTYCQHIAYQIKNAIVSTGNIFEDSEILITGGGAFNGFLVGQIQSFLNKLNIKVSIPSKSIIDYKEAIVMAFMGVLYLRNETNCIASVTGATSDSICGDLYD